MAQQDEHRINTMQLAHVTHGDVVLYEYVDAKAAEEYVERVAQQNPDRAAALDIKYTSARVYRIPVVKDTFDQRLSIDMTMIDERLPFKELHPPAWATDIEVGSYVAVAVVDDGPYTKMIPAGELPRYIDDEYSAPPFGKGFR